MKLSRRIDLLEVALAQQYVAEPYAAETALAVEEFSQRISAMRERFLADPGSYPPWENRSAAEKWATAETPEQWAEAKVLIEEAVARSKENQQRFKEQVWQYQATQPKRRATLASGARSGAY